MSATNRPTVTLRILRRAFICAVLGLVLNVATAWSIAAFHDSDKFERLDMQVAEFSDCSYFINARSKPGAEEINFNFSDLSAAVHQRMTRNVTTNPDHRWARHDSASVRATICSGSDICTISESAFGWPWLSFSYSVLWPCDWSKQGRIVYENEFEDAVVLRKRTTATGPGSTARALPMRPMWTGLVLNTVLYGIFMWCLWTLGTAIWRSERSDTA